MLSALIDGSLSEKIDKLERNTGQLFKVVFERLDYIDSKAEGEKVIKRNKVGFKN